MLVAAWAGCGPLALDGGTSAPAIDSNGAGEQPNALVPGPDGTAGNGNTGQTGANPNTGNGGAGGTQDNPTGDGNVAGGAGGGNANGTEPAVAAVRFLGRLDATVAAPVLSWSGSGVAATFRGTGGTANFKGLSGTTYFGLSLDGQAPTRVQLPANGQVRFGPVATGEHTVQLSKLNEAELGVAQYVDLTVDGVLLPTAAPARRLEFVGGSMTLGYGIEGVDPCSNNAAMENVLLAYSGQTATMLGAELTVVAWSGRGLTRNSIGVSGALLPALYPRARADQDGSTYSFAEAQAPQAVVFNFGTNDFAYQGSPARPMLDQNAFAAAYTAFVADVRARYPKALVVLTTSPMLSNSTSERQHDSLLAAVQKVRQNLGNTNVKIVDFPSQSGTKTGCNTHPNPATHTAMAQLLVPVLRDALGW